MDTSKLKKDLIGWVVTILAVLAFRAFLYEPVYIPSGSMIPTLEVGDYVVVEKWAYGLRFPFTETAQLTWRSPKRGDIVVLLPPAGNASNDDLIKRVVAVGGDTVAIQNGGLVLNGKPVPHVKVERTCDYWDKDQRTGEWIHDPCLAYREELDDHHYETYCTPGSLTCGDDMPPRTIPQGMVFLSGDHRDHSQDSRYFGAQPVGRIKGRAWVALMSWGPDGPRWKRFFHRVDK